MPHKKDTLLLALVILVMVALPLAIGAYNRLLRTSQLPSGAKEFTLTGTAHQGWVLGEVQAHDMVVPRDRNQHNPVIMVNRGDRVALKLRSADVTHGFSLKAFDIYIPDGIRPGNTVFANFTAHKSGTFEFWCTTYCGDIHPKMKGTLIVQEP